MKNRPSQLTSPAVVVLSAIMLFCVSAVHDGLTTPAIPAIQSAASAAHAALAARPCIPPLLISPSPPMSSWLPANPGQVYTQGCKHNSHHVRLYHSWQCHQYPVHLTRITKIRTKFINCLCASANREVSAYI